jgi:guanylate kinase
MSARGELLEHATVFGNGYGTPRAPVEEVLSSGKDVVGDVDWQGTQQLAKSVPSDLVSVFILPPSTAALAERLSTRAQDSAAVVAARMAKSAEEMSHWPEYDYVIINRDVDESVAQARAIVTAERLRRTRLFGLSDFVCSLSSDRSAKLG